MSCQNAIEVRAEVNTDNAKHRNIGRRQWNDLGEPAQPSSWRGFETDLPLEWKCLYR